MKPPLTAETVQSCTRELRRNLQSIAGQIYKPLPGLTLETVAGMLGTKFRDIRNCHQPVLVTGRSFRRVLPAPHLTHKPNIFLQERTVWLFSTLDNLLPSSGRLSGHWRCFRDSLGALLESVAIVVSKRQRRSGSVFWQVRWAEPSHQLLDDLVRDAESLVESGEAMYGLMLVHDEPETTDDVHDEPASPNEYLRSWMDIVSALDMKNTKENIGAVKYANRTKEGPVRIGTKGQRPLVVKSDLIEWWNRLCDQLEELKRQRENSEETVRTQHKFGRSGVVVPEISGSVKQRRTSKTNVTKPA